MLKFNEPLGQPQGTVRAAITLALLGATIALHAFGKNDPFIDGLTSLAVGFYIGQRTGETNSTSRSESEVLMPTTTMPEHPGDESMPTYVPGE